MPTARLVPELLIQDLRASLTFWRDLLGFTIAYERPAEGFVFLELEGIAFMLAEGGKSKRTWVTGLLEPPLGRGINFEITVSTSYAPILDRLREAQWPLYLEPEVKWYKVGDLQQGVRQFLVQDPDGYLLRIAEPL